MRAARSLADDSERPPVLVRRAWKGGRGAWPKGVLVRRALNLAEESAPVLVWAAWKGAWSLAEGGAGEGGVGEGGTKRDAGEKGPGTWPPRAPVLQPVLQPERSKCSRAGPRLCHSLRNFGMSAGGREFE